MLVLSVIFLLLKAIGLGIKSGVIAMGRLYCTRKRRSVVPL